LCEVLCFAVNKYGKTAVKLLKSSLTDFYSVEVLADAKKQLAEDTDQLNLPARSPRVPSRREGDGRIEREVSGIVLLLHPRDAMLVRLLAMALCPSVSVCLSQVGVLSKRINESSWFLAW